MIGTLSFYRTGLIFSTFGGKNPALGVSNIVKKSSELSFLESIGLCLH
jgi:hypothetical protein